MDLISDAFKKYFDDNKSLFIDKDNKLTEFGTLIFACLAISIFKSFFRGGKNE